MAYMQNIPDEIKGIHVMMDETKDLYDSILISAFREIVSAINKLEAEVKDIKERLDKIGGKHE